MKIKMRTTAASPEGCLQAGKVYEVEVNFGKALIEGEYAVEVDAPKQKQEALIQPEGPKPEEVKAKGKK